MPPLVLLLLLLLLLLLSESRGQEEVCMKTGPCSCETIHGKIDLTPLANNDGTPRNPCKDFTQPNTSFVCSNVAICQGYYMNPKPLFFNLGIQSDVMFLYDNTNTITLQYVHYYNATRISVIRLVCDAEEEGRLTVTGERPPTRLIYDFELRSKYACFMPFPAISAAPITATQITRAPPHLYTTPSPSPDPNLTAVETVIFLLVCILLVVSLVFVLLVILVPVLLCKVRQLTTQGDNSSSNTRHYLKF